MSTALPIRRFQWTDIPALAKLENRLQAGQEDAMPVTERWLGEYLGQPNLNVTEDCFLYEANGGLRGYALVCPEPSIRRGILELKALPDAGNLDVERALVRRALQRAAQLGATVLHIQVDRPSPLDRLLTEEGFQPVRVYLNMRWEVQPLPSAPPPEGFSFRKYGLPGDAATLARIQNAAFGGSWGFSPNTPEEISYRVGMSITSPEGIIFLCQGEQVSGYNWTLLLGRKSAPVGVISMIGIDPEFRQRRLGRPLLHAGLEYLVSQGVAFVQLEVDKANAPATRLYDSVGFREMRQRQWYEASLAGYSSGSA